jgi:hypothetical protein
MRDFLLFRRDGAQAVCVTMMTGQIRDEGPGRVLFLCDEATGERVSEGGVMTGAAWFLPYRFPHIEKSRTA